MWINMETLNDSIEFDFDFYITSIPRHLKDIRIDWLKRNKFPIKPVYISDDKVKIAEELGVDILIDDKPENIVEWIASGRKAIQYIPHYSEMPIVSPYYTHEFSQIGNLIDLIKLRYYE